MAMTFQPGGSSVDKPVMQPRLQVRSFPAADGPNPDCYQIIRNQVTGVVQHDSIAGTVDLKIASGPQDPLEDLGVREVLGGELSRYDFLLGYGDIVKDLSPAKTAG